MNFPNNKTFPVEVEGVLPLDRIIHFCQQVTREAHLVKSKETRSNHMSRLLCLLQKLN